MPSHHFPLGVSAYVLKYCPVLLNAVFEGAKNVKFHVGTVLNAWVKPYRRLTLVRTFRTGTYAIPALSERMRARMLRSLLEFT